MNTKKLAEIALLTATALIIHALESLIPPVVPIPGVKLGLSNVITVFALYRLKRREAALVVLARILLSSAFAGSLSSLIYSAAGSALSLAVMLPLKRGIPPKYMCVLSALGAVAHNLGQLCAAYFVTETPALVFAFLPALTVSAIISGLFTGLCAAFVYSRLESAKL